MPTSFEFDHAQFLMRITEAIYDGMKRRDIDKEELARLIDSTPGCLDLVLSHRVYHDTVSMVEMSRALGLRWKISLE